MATFGFVAFDQMVNQAAKITYMFGGQARFPILYRMRNGLGQCAAAQHSVNPYSMYMNVPGLKIILGHLGEALPFLLARMDYPYVIPWFDRSTIPPLEKKPSDYIKENVFVTTSGMYYEPAFTCTYKAMGIERILLGTDYPYEDPKECMNFLEGIGLSADDKDRIYGGNTEQLGIHV